MATFLKTIKGDFINAAHIKKIIGEGNRFFAWFGEDSVELNPGDDFEKLVAPVLPAQPGFELLTVWFDEDGKHIFEREPIVAWRANDSGCVDPITLTPDFQLPSFDRGATAIRFPDGQVMLGEERFASEKAASEKAWIEWANEKASEIEKKRA